MNLPITLAPGVALRMVPDHPAYFVGDDGSLWSCYVIGTHGIRANKWRRVKGHIRNGYRRHAIDGKWIDAHRLVLEAFVGPCPPGSVACHYDGNRLNNHVSNLRWDTYKANSDDQRRHGMILEGDRHQNAKLRSYQIAEIRALLREGFSCEAVARRFGVAYGTIDAIRSGKTWRHVD